MHLPSNQGCSTVFLAYFHDFKCCHISVTTLLIFLISSVQILTLLCLLNSSLPSLCFYHCFPTSYIFSCPSPFHPFSLLCTFCTTPYSCSFSSFPCTSLILPSFPYPFCILPTLKVPSGWMMLTVQFNTRC